MYICTVTVLSSIALKFDILHPENSHMSNPRANASPSTRGTIYQLCTAVQAGFALQPGQRLLVEEFGDITVPDDYQKEVKHYSDSLTDGHTNFWNTLYNWCLGSTNVSNYCRLVLSTTQPFGARAKISKWNTLDDQQRLDLLINLHEESEQRFAGEPPGKKVPPVLAQQRSLLAAEQRIHLREVVNKVVIDAAQPMMNALFSELASTWFRPVPDEKRATALHSLIGFVCRPDMQPGASWEIAYESFNKEYSDLVHTHGVMTREFPRAAYERQLETETQIPVVADPFIKKLMDIDHQGRIPVAIRDYQSVIETIDEEFRNYTTNNTRLKVFRVMVSERFDLTYETACKGATTDIAAAQCFYNETMSSVPPSFAGYLDSPDWFRNGLLHTLMNDEKKLYQWKLVAP